MLRSLVDTADASVGERRADIRRLLVERRRELLNEIQSRVRDVREEDKSSKYHHTTHLGETFEVEPEDDLAFALIQMKGEMLEKVNEAIRECDEGTYGYCVDCGEAIASSRLRAMPSAVRCRDCEEEREDEQHRHRVQLHRMPSVLGSRP